MKKTFVVVLLVLLMFFLEYLLSGIFGAKYIPNLLLLLIIFINLTLGIRYSLLSAALGGLIKDSFGIHMFGFYLFSFMFSAFMTTILAKYVYQKGSRLSLFSLILIICVVNLMTQCILSMSFVRFAQVIRQIFVPEILSTIIVANYTFKYLRRCVLKLYG